MLGNCILKREEKMIIFVLLPLLALFPTHFGIVSQPIYISSSQLPALPSVVRMNSLEQVRVILMSASFNPSAQAPSPASQGLRSSFTGRTLRRHHRHGHRIKSYAVPQSPSATHSCQTCLDPLTSAPFGSPCACVFPMRIRLLLGVPVFAVFSEATELEIEVAAGTFLQQSQVTIVGASADDQDREKAVVDINLIPLGKKFDITTATLTYQRFLQKKVPLNRSIFGDYDVLYINYPGLPPSPPGNLSDEGPSGSTGNHSNPITANVGGKNKKINPQIDIVISLSSFVLLVVCLAAIAVLINCMKASELANAVSSVFTSSINKRSGTGSALSSSLATSISDSLVSAMPSSILSVKTFSLAELQKVTEKFSPRKVLGEGGFGRVYHGIMEDGSEVAVKLLTRDTQNREREFISEIELLSRLHHRNLVKLIGICIEGSTRCLVYELVPNGSVESHLHGADRRKGPLSWNARLKIALGAARGLAYLHEDSNPRVIHRDFKASNILLEDDFTPKVSDFGLAREAAEGSHHISTRVMGTFGYVAPEYAMTGHLLVKSDVYSYGVVLLELISGRKAVDSCRPPEQQNLVIWARPLLTHRKGLEELVDPSLSGGYDFDDMAKVAAIASMCVNQEVTHRPFMGEVVQALKLIYNDVDEACGDINHSHGESSACDSDLKDDFALSDSNWWDAARRAYLQASPFVTMEYSSGSLEERENGPFSGGVASSMRHGNGSGPLRILRSNRAFYRLEQGSVSEHGGVLVRKRALDDDRGHGTPF